MINKITKTASCALLIFAKSADFESNTKNIVSSKKKNISLWNKLNNKTLKIAQNSIIPYFISDENSQKGENFGEKIANSIQTVFDKGFEKVIVIGNDCPELKTSHLKKAQLELQKNDLVFGPDFKGGIYLLGISKKEFNATDFKQFHWQSKYLNQNISSFYSNKKVYKLPLLNDFNSLSSFKKAIAKLLYKSKFKINLLKLITFLNDWCDEIKCVYFSLSVNCNQLRGPPQLAI